MPSSVGHYVIEQTLYKDELGIFYAAVDPKRGRNVTIRTIAKSLVDAWGFAREVQRAMQLKHPNIVEIYGFGDERDVAYLVMEFLKGRDLARRFGAEERFDLEATKQIIRDVCDALTCAHDARMVHGDVHPGNVIVDEQGRAKLGGFGIARPEPGEDAPATALCPSPEQVTHADIDHRTDVFSAGTVFYRLLTGHKPFTGSGVWTVAKKILQDEPVAPSELNNSLSLDVDLVMRKALAKKPDQRYQSARELGRALESALEGPEEIVGLADPVRYPHLRVSPPDPQPSVGARSGGRAVQEVEVEFWRTISASQDAHDFELYLEQFPEGLYAELAKRRLTKLTGG